MKRLGILTGGGDVPGLNPAIRATTLAAMERGIEVVGLKAGWQSLVAVVPDDPRSVQTHSMPLTADAVRHTAVLGGTLLQSSRTNPRRMPFSELASWHSHQNLMRLERDEHDKVDATALVLTALERLQIDTLVAIGGEDTLGYAAHLAALGVSVMGIPKTMDNDVPGTELCLGFATCVARSVEYLHQLRTCCASHGRFGVVEVMGRNSGATSLVPAYLAEVDRTLIAEVPFHEETVADLLMGDRRNNPPGYALVTVSEGARPVEGATCQSGAADSFGHRKLGGIGSWLSERLTARTGIATITQSLGYLVRSGRPDPVDMMLGAGFGRLAVELLTEGQSGRLVAVNKGVFNDMPLSEVSRGQRPVDVARYYDSATYRPRIEAMRHRPVFLG